LKKEVFDMPEPVGDESTYLHVEQLQKGLLQFTDTTNAYRLFAAHGREIRYNALWKKWIVWDGKRWQTDDGYMIHDRGLKMIRAIYAEQLKTSDYRDRMEIEKYAVQSESARRRKAFVEAASWIPELNVRTDDLDKDPLAVKRGERDYRPPHRGTAGTAAGGFDHQDRQRQI
jgi:putative DNA primase/helicase